MNNVIKIFGFDNCPYCTELKTLLENEGVLYTYMDITKAENRAEYDKVAEVSKCSDLPIIQVNHHLIIPEVSFTNIPDVPALIKRLLS